MGATRYGTEAFGRLRTVMVHNPGGAIRSISSLNCRDYLFDRAPDPDRYLEEHAAYVALLRQQGVHVFELAEHVSQNRDLLEKLPNLAYMHDIAVITRRGAILSKMCFGGRKSEEVAVREALTHLGIPIFYEFGRDDVFEGCLLLSPRTMFIAETERHKDASIERFIPEALTLFDEVVYVDIPDERRFMHPDMVFGMVSEHLAVAYLPAFLRTTLVTRDGRVEIDDTRRFMETRGIEIVSVSDDEQQRWACTFVPLEPNVVIHYDIAWNERTKAELARRGVRMIEFHPDALLAGGGSLRCLTLQLWRDQNPSNF